MRLLSVKQPQRLNCHCVRATGPKGACGAGAPAPQLRRKHAVGALTQKPLRSYLYGLTFLCLRSAEGRAFFVQLFSSVVRVLQCAR